jgi:hypothetical protein
MKKKTSDFFIIVKAPTQSEADQLMQEALAVVAAGKKQAIPVKEGQLDISKIVGSQPQPEPPPQN